MKTFKQSVLEAVLGGASSIDDVLGVCGNLVTAARATAACRRKDRSERKRGRRFGNRSVHANVAIGRRTLTQTALNRLANEGKIRRLSRGVYAPPLPKIHQPQAG